MGRIFSCFRRPIRDEMQPIKAAAPLPAGSISLPTEKKQKTGHSKSTQNKLIRNLENKKTLEDCLLASPNFNAYPLIVLGAGEIQTFKHLPRRVYPSSTSPDINQDYFTPRRSFSDADCKLGSIEEDHGEELEDDGNQEEELSGESNSISRSSSGNRKAKKKVRFRLPEEADIYIYYTPKEEFQES